MGIRVCTELGVELEGLRAGNQLCNLAIWIIQIAEIAGLGHTVSDAGRGSLPIDAGHESLCQAGIDTMPAIIALHHHALLVYLVADPLEGREPLVPTVSPLILTEVACPVRTSDDAILATDAFFLVDEDDAIGTLLRRFRRA